MLNIFASKSATTIVEPYVYEDDKELQTPTTPWYRYVPVVATVAAIAVPAVCAVVNAATQSDS